VYVYEKTGLAQCGVPVGAKAIAKMDN